MGVPSSMVGDTYSLEGGEGVMLRTPILEASTRLTMGKLTSGQSHGTSARSITTLSHWNHFRLRSLTQPLRLSQQHEAVECRLGRYRWGNRAWKSA